MRRRRAPAPSVTPPRPALTALARRGRIAYRLTVGARVRFTVERLVAGHRRGGRCGLTAAPAGGVRRRAEFRVR